MIKTILYIVMIGFVVIQWGCSNYVYSPAVLLSQKPLQRGAVDVKGGVGLFPKVKPSEPYTTEGGVLDVGVGVTDNFSLYGNAWSDLSTETFFYKAGVSLASRVSVWNSMRSEVLFYPRVALLKNGQEFDALGFQLSALYVTSLSKGFYTYQGIAGISGNRSLNDRSSDNEKLYGVLGHIGFGYESESHFRVMVELNPVYQYNKYFDKGNFLVSPTISIGYMIGMSPNEGSKYKSERKRK